MARYAIRLLSPRLLISATALAVALVSAAKGAPPESSAPSQSSKALMPAAPDSPAANPAAIRGVPRSDKNSQTAHEMLLKKAAQGGIDLYFEGDSITRRWGTSDPQYKTFLAHWKESFFGWNAGNFGWGGDTVQNILWRLEHGELDGVNPKVIVLMAGTNNLGNQPLAENIETRAAEVVHGLQAILSLMQQKAPGAAIILMGVIPRNDRQNDANMRSVISRVNQLTAQLADGKKIRFLNINDKLAGPDGKLFEGVTVDGLHLSLKGYQIWADALKPILTELIGPPASTDHAPTPTGDPSIQSKH